jgi:hypothetical protein
MPAEQAELPLAARPGNAAIRPFLAQPGSLCWFDGIDGKRISTIPSGRRQERRGADRAGFASVEIGCPRGRMRAGYSSRIDWTKS